MSRFSSETEQLLKRAGWFEGRCDSSQVEAWAHEMESPDGFKMSSVARSVLKEFGGLHIKPDGPGLECARSDIEINPLLAKCEEDRFFSFSCFQSKQVFPLGEAVVGHTFAAIDEEGKVHLVMQEVQLVANSFDAALESLLLGMRSHVIETAA
jgi:hypothetical protein